MKLKLNRFAPRQIPWSDTLDVILRLLRNGEIPTWFVSPVLTFTCNGRTWEHVDSNDQIRVSLDIEKGLTVTYKCPSVWRRA